MEADVKLLSLDNDRQFERIKELSWYPWVGKNYFHARRKILIVAESHYNTGDNIHEKQERTKGERWTTRDVVQIYPVSHSYDNNMFENLHRVLFRTNHIDRESVWSNIAFYNFVQRPMNYNGNEWQKERPNGSDLEAGWRVFYEIIKILRPTDCIFIGVAAADAFNENASKIGFEHKSVEWRKVEDCKRYARHFSLSIDDYSLNCTAIQHTSHHFSWKAWNKYLTSTNKVALNYLNQIAHTEKTTTDEENYIEAIPTQRPPYWLQHKPIYSCDYNATKPGSDLKYISLGRAQWDNKCSTSVKAFRINNDGKYSRMSEEIPIDRLPEMTMILLSAIKATQAHRCDKSMTPTYLHEEFVSEEIDFLDDQFHKNSVALHKSLSEIKRLINDIDLDNI